LIMLKLQGFVNSKKRFLAVLVIAAICAVDPWEGGLDIYTLRNRYSLGDWGKAWRRIASGWADSRGLPTAAIGYLLKPEEEKAKKIIGAMKKTAAKTLQASNIYNKQEVLNDLSIAYDWVYDSPAFSDRDKKKIGQDMATLAEKMIRYLRGDHHIFSRAMGQIASVGMVGLALYGDHPDAEKFIDYADSELKKVFEACEYLDGTWAEGVGYLNEARIPCLLEYLEAYKSATEPSFNYFEYIAETQNDWLRKVLYFHIYNLRPDNTWSRFGDISSYKAYPKDNFAQNLDILVTEYQDTYGADFLYRLERAISPDPLYYKGYLFKKLLFSEPSIPLRPGVEDLPKEAIFGKDSLGYVVIRSGWGADDVFFRFNCGDYFTGHQHADQGSFVIFKGAPLAIDSGYYSEWGTQHHENYYRRTIAHNTMLVFDPKEKFQSPFDYGKLNDGGQRTVWYYGRSAQQSSFTLKQHLSKNNRGAHFETGNINAYEAGENYVYIDADVSAAYNNDNFSSKGNKPKIKSFKRQIVCLKPSYYFVIYDSVVAADKTFPVVWLLHSLAKPESLSGKLDAAGFYYETYLSDMFKIDNAEGRLFVKTVYPEDPRLTFIGGEGYEFFVNGENQSGGVPFSLEKYAEPGNWRVEIEPSKRMVNNYFLNVLYPTDINTATPVLIQRLEGESMKGVKIGRDVVMFVAGTKMIAYKVNDEFGTRHLVCGLPKGAVYSVSWKDATTGEGYRKDLVVTENGVLEFFIEQPLDGFVKVEKNESGNNTKDG